MARSSIFALASSSIVSKSLNMHDVVFKKVFENGLVFGLIIKAENIKRD